METRDFALWLFAAIMVLSPMIAGSRSNPYHGNEPIVATQPK